MKAHKDLKDFALELLNIGNPKDSPLYVHPASLMGAMRLFNDSTRAVVKIWSLTKERAWA